MDSFSRSSKIRARGLRILLVMGALLLVGAIAGAPADADPVVAAAAAPPAGVAAPAANEAAASHELAKEIQVGLMRIVPADMRIDRVTLGCKPPAGATLVAVAPGVTSLTSRSFMVELQTAERTMFCSAAIDASRQLMTATHDLDPNAPAGVADFQSSWVDAFSTAPGALANFPSQGPYVSATSIRAGQPLYQNSLMRPIAVHPGDLVTVLVKNGPVTVRAQLQAQTQAAVGDSATMINPGSGMPVAVTVTGPKTAELVMQ
jgi:flagella basal body P-ring formation protein FlgA